MTAWFEPITCSCGNTDPDKFEVAVDHCSPQHKGERGSVVLKGWRCMACQTVHELTQAPAA